MILQNRIELAIKLGNYMLSDDPDWMQAMEKAERENPWFIRRFILHAAEQIARYFLDASELEKWLQGYQENGMEGSNANVGLVMSGNIPIAGFHDMLCIFLSGHKMVAKASSRDEVLITHLANKLKEWAPELENALQFKERIAGCDAYIASGSNNSSRYFEYYFGKYPNIIRKNRSSVAILDGTETMDELSLLADDIHLYFGLGCRSVTKLFVPEAYEFEKLLEALRKYAFLAEHNRYKNNYDYNLALHILNRKYYMTNGSVLLVEDGSFSAPVSELHYAFEKEPASNLSEIQSGEQVQVVVGYGGVPFGTAQSPRLNDYADGIDTMRFLKNLNVLAS